MFGGSSILWCLLVFTIGTRSQTVIEECDVKTTITNRYAETNITTFIRNDEASSKEHSFKIAIPENAFISFFECQQGSDVMTAVVMEKGIAKSIYKNARNSGSTSGMISSAVRNSNEFNVMLNIKKRSKMACTLKYEEFLRRETSEFKTARFEHIITIFPDHLPDNMKAEVRIDDSLPLIFNKFQDARLIINTENTRKEDNVNSIDRSAILKKGRKRAKINFSKSIKEQLGKLHSRSELKSVELHVLYDVNRGAKDNIVAVKDGYFIHSVVPQTVDRIPRYVVFVLDVSGSMMYEKLRYLKDAMQNILSDLREKDYVNILTFTTKVSPWTPTNSNVRHKFLGINGNKAYKVTKDLIKDARNFINQMTAGGGTNIYNGLKEALKMVKSFEDKKGHSSEEGLSKASPMIILLSDGQGVTPINTVISHIKNYDMTYLPIHSLAFGKDADITTLRKISETGPGEFRKIYEAEDAAIQLNKFYWQVCNPKMKDVKITYGDAFTNATQKQWNIFYEGEELVVTGKVQQPKNKQSLEIKVIGKDQSGTVNYNETFLACFQQDVFGLPIPGLSNTQMLACDNVLDMPVGAKPERMHAFLRVKDLLKADQLDSGKRHTALRLSLEHQFVTPLTSMVFTGNYTQNHYTKILLDLEKQILQLSNSDADNNDFFNDVPPMKREKHCNETARDEIIDLAQKKCAIILYPDTELRNISKPALRLESSGSRLRADYLSDFNFDDELLSFKTEGDCCWEIFEGADFTGRSKIFPPGVYKSSTDLGPGLIKDASSLMASRCCIEDFYQLYQSWYS